MTPKTFAAIDLGSNSFHMVIARVGEGVPEILDRHKEPVRLAAGLDEQGMISEEARERALDTLARFGQRIRNLPDLTVRAVGTNTLRRARKSRRFRAEAEERLGHPIEVVSGDEEARLVYLGVAHSLPKGKGNRLVIDIGGGSTEAIVGEGFSPRRTASVPLGCVSWSKRFFPEGEVVKGAFERAVLAAQRELHPIIRQLRYEKWSEVIGASGTIRAATGVANALIGSGEILDREGLQAVQDAVLASRKSKVADIPGLSAQRAPVFAGGFAALVGVFESLDIESMRLATGALREGLIYDFLGRFEDEDVRARTIGFLQKRFDVDTDQAERVEKIALHLFDQVSKSWDLKLKDDRRFLRWATKVHEIGLSISWERHHRHGAYILGGARMPGFSEEEQAVLAALVGNHRRRPRAADFDSLVEAWAPRARKLVVILRLAVLLSRGRKKIEASALGLRAKNAKVCLKVTPEWLEERPLTRLDLEMEANRLPALDFEISY